MSGEVARSECRFRLVREGEVSPYKILLTLFIRENYSVDIRKILMDPSEERPVFPQTLILIYQLITSGELSYTDFKERIESPSHKVRPEVLKRMTRILSNLDPSNSYFLYELAHSIIATEPSQTVILKKRIGKNSPVGKFLRNVYMNIRRLSYPQVHFLYNQLTTYITTTPRKLSQDNNSSATSTSSANKSTLEVNKVSKKEEAHSTKFKGLELFQKLGQRVNEPGNYTMVGNDGMELFNQYIMEYRKLRENFSQEDEDLYLASLKEKNVRIEKAKESSKSLRDLWKPKFVPRELRDDYFGGFERSEGDEFFSFGKGKRRSSSRRATSFSPSKPTVRSPRKSKSLTPGRAVASEFQQQFTVIEEGDNDYFLPDVPFNQNESMLTSTPTKSPVKSPFKGKRKITPVKENKSLKAEEPEVLDEKKWITREISPSGRWSEVKWWSRRQIERVLKSLASRLYHSHSDVPSPTEISEFIEAILRNPSSHVLQPQLHFLEYLNGLRIKDLNRCSESLRLSFDIRIKPNAPDLNKGSPYAAYNFALFYSLLGYKKDALRSLDEAFRAGHAAGDATCIHYCNNLWSMFYNRPYQDAIVTVTKEVDNNMAYLHSVNVVANAFNCHYNRLPTEEVLYTLWHYNAECDLEEMEGILLTSLASFLTVFGWHEMISFPCQMILHTRLKWPTKAYCFALSSLCQSLLFHGDVHVPTALMEYGKEVFGSDASSAGELFVFQHAVFKAMRAYLGCHSLEHSLVATISSFSLTEGLYWQAYSCMMDCNWQEAGNILNKLWLSFDQVTYEINDMKIRCLLLQAELECLCETTGGALNYLSVGLELAYSIYSDFYVTLILSHIASVQCEMGLLTTASRTMHKDMRAAIRCSSPWLKARLNLVNVKLSMRLQRTIPKTNLNALMNKLDWAEDLYTRWENNYRIKEVLDLKSELMDRSEDLIENGNVFRKRLASLECSLPWSSSTCLI